MAAERSQSKGYDYSDNVRSWLRNVTFLGLKIKEFGFAYDASQGGAKMGGKQFDFSCMLKNKYVTKKILYVECKYQSEPKNTNGKFFTFINESYKSLKNSNSEERDDAVFCFISTTPPDIWRKFLRDPRECCSKVVEEKMKNAAQEQGASGDFEPDPQIIDLLSNKIHILVLSKEIIGG